MHRISWMVATRKKRKEMEAKAAPRDGSECRSRSHGQIQAVVVFGQGAVQFCQHSDDDPFLAITAAGRAPRALLSDDGDPGKATPRARATRCPSTSAVSQ
jgi:hypothetical protein